MITVLGATDDDTLAVKYYYGRVREWERGGDVI